MQHADHVLEKKALALESGDIAWVLAATVLVDIVSQRFEQITPTVSQYVTTRGFGFAFRFILGSQTLYECAHLLYEEIPKKS
jgi:hypothetical protein